MRCEPIDLILLGRNNRLENLNLTETNVVMIETNRLCIRHLNEADWQDMKRIFTDFNHSEYAIYDMPLPTNNEETKALTKRFADSNLFFAVFLKESSEMLGYVCFHKDGDSYDLGY